jgi:large subunit ribosomal protein L18
VKSSVAQVRAMLASPALAGAHSFAASVSGNLRIPLPSVASPSPTPTPARRAALSVVAKVKVSTPQDDRIARHVRLRKKVRNLHEEPILPRAPPFSLLMWTHESW